MSKRLKTSSVWSVFKEDKSKQQHARCDICGLVLSFRSSISNLKKHIDRKHPTVVLQSSNALNPANPDDPPAPSSTPHTSCSGTPSTWSRPTAGPSGSEPVNQYLMQPSNEGNNAMVSPAASNNPKPRQMSLSAFIPRQVNEQEKKRLDNLLLKLFTDDIQPFSVVDDTGFKGFVTALNPRYTLPSRKVITQTLIPARYEQCYNVVKAKLAEAESICLTTDCWTSAANESYLALTGHFLTQDFELQSVLLECAQIMDSHTSENLASVIKRIAQEFGIEDKVILVVSDNAANIVSAVKNDLQWKHFGCYAHTLNLIVKDALKDDVYISNLKENIKTVVSHFKRSSTSMEKLIQFQKNNGVKVPLKLVQEVPTRWNSTYYMIKRFVELQDAVRISIALIDKDLPVLSTDDWQNCKEICDVLEPMEDVTKRISGEQYVVGSQIIGLTRGLVSVYGKMVKDAAFNSVAKNLIVNIQTGLLQRFQNLEEHSAIATATFFDPRFKLHVFTRQSAASKIKTHVTQLVTKEMNKTYNPHVRPEQEASTEERAGTSKYSVWEEYDSFIATKMPAGTATSSAITEIQRYLEDPVHDRKKDPLMWWKERKFVYPTLSKLVLNHFNVVASSVPCERIFSKTGSVISDRRSRLKPTKVKEIVFLNANYSLIE